MSKPRVLIISDRESAVRELKKLQCDPQGIYIMAPKAVFKTIKLESVPAKAANLLKQTFLAKGGEVAVARGVADLSVEATDVIICATLKQYHLALTQLKSQPWGLPAMAANIESVLHSDSSVPQRQYFWKDRSLTLESGRTLIMGILNVTPDSFSDGGKYTVKQLAIRHAREMVENGADIIDIGAESTRPYGAQPISAAEEAERLLPVLEELLASVRVPVSVDTYKASVAEAALELGAHIINDVWGLQKDPDMAGVVACYQVPVIVMHNQPHTGYEQDIMSHIINFLSHSIEIGRDAGIADHRFIVDPGIGFGKTSCQNLEVMARLREMKALGCPIVLGTSRKRFIGEILGLEAGERLEGTGATVAWGISQGANIIRVHDVKEMARVAKMTDAIKRGDHDGG